MPATRSKPSQESPPVETLPTILPPRPPTLRPANDAMPMDWPTNYDLATTEGKAGLINAANPPAWLPQDGGTYRITAVNWVVYPDERTDEETGEVQQYCRVVFIDRDGKSVKFSSDFSARRLHAVVKLFTADEWKQGIVIECYTAKSRRPGRSEYGSFKVIGVSPITEVI